MKQVFVVEGEAERLDKAIAAGLEGVSRRRARSLISQGAVFVDGKRCRVASRNLPTGTRVVVHDSAEPEAVPDVPILYEDDDIVVVDKPAGVHVNETETSPRRSLEWILSERNVLVVHRLDVDTTGVLVFARSKSVAADLSRAFAEQRVEKTYFAVTEGAPETTLVDAPIGADRRRPRARAIQPRGKPSRTRVEVVARADGFAAVVARPETGRTHQIRVHLAHAGTPIAGDVLYGGHAAGSLGGAVVDFERPLLHAARLVLPRPGGPMTFVAPLPADLAALGPAGLLFPDTQGLASET